MIFTPTKEQVRHFFCEARRKQREHLPLDGAETIAADVIALHPEYHALLDDTHEALHRLLECLGETVWHAQQPGGIFDTEAYQERLRKL